MHPAWLQMRVGVAPNLSVPIVLQRGRKFLTVWAPQELAIVFRPAMSKRGCWLAPCKTRFSSHFHVVIANMIEFGFRVNKYTVDCAKPIRDSLQRSPSERWDHCAIILYSLKSLHVDLYR